MWLEVEGLSSIVKSFGNNEMSLASQVSFWPRSCIFKSRCSKFGIGMSFGHLDAKMANLADKVKRLDNNEQQYSLS